MIRKCYDHFTPPPLQKGNTGPAPVSKCKPREGKTTTLNNLIYILLKLQKFTKLVDVMKMNSP